MGQFAGYASEIALAACKTLAKAKSHGRGATRGLALPPRVIGMAKKALTTPAGKRNDYTARRAAMPPTPTNDLNATPQTPPTCAPSHGDAIAALRGVPGLEEVAAVDALLRSKPPLTPRPPSARRARIYAPSRSRRFRRAAVTRDAGKENERDFARRGARGARDE